MDNVEKKLAQKIWDIPFAAANLEKLTKKELLMLIEEIITDYSYKNEEWHELDIKDILWEEKIWLIEMLDPQFFEKEKK